MQTGCIQCGQGQVASVRGQSVVAWGTRHEALWIGSWGTADGCVVWDTRHEAPWIGSWRDGRGAVACGHDARGALDRLLAGAAEGRGPWGTRHEALRIGSRRDG